MDCPERPAGGVPAVLFRADGYRCAVEAAAVAAMVAAPPDAAPIEGLLGLPLPPPGARRRALWLHGHAGAVTVAEPVLLTALAPAALHPLPPLVAARTTLRALVGLALDADGPILLLDLGALAAAPLA